MRILSWTELFWPYIGGIEVRNANFLAALLERGHDVSVITSHGSLELPDEENWKGIPIHRFRFPEALSEHRLDLFAGALRGVAVAKQRFQPDLVHIQFTDPSPLFHWHTEHASAHRSRPPVPTVVTIPISLPDRASDAGTLAGRTLSSAAWVVACSRATLDHTLRQAPEIAEKSSVIYNALPIPGVAPRPLPAGPPVLLTIGRLVREKGFDVAIEAMALVLGQFPGARLIIAGDGPERQALEGQTNRLGIASQVEFAGWVGREGIADLINRASMVLMPSRWEEAFGLVALEAMQMARPVVATRVGGLPEVVADGTSGILVPKENSEAMAHAVTRLLADPALARNMGANGRELAQRKFSFGRFITDHERLYDKTVNKAHD